MRRKLVPAFLELWSRGVLNEECLIVGVGRRLFESDAFRVFLGEAMNEEQRAILWRIPLRYFMGDITSIDGLQGLRVLLEKHEPRSCMGRMFYLATSYTYFPTIVAALAREGLNELRCGWTRVLFEKPFGQSFASAGELESGVHKVFSEDAIYRIDHYLAKEGARLFLAAKESCLALRKILSRAYVSRIEIIADESIGVGDRLAYYQTSGAVKDMIQSHLLQLAALVISEPATWSAEAIHRAKLRSLRSLKLGDHSTHLLGQYASFAQETGIQGVEKEGVETYARLTLQSTLPSWSGVPIIVRSGKKLSQKRTEIIIHFRPGNEGAGELHLQFHPIPHIEDFETERISDSRGAQKSKISDEPQSPLSNRFENPRRTSKLESYSKLSIEFTFTHKIPPALQSAADEVAVFARSWKPCHESEDGYSFLLEQAIAGDKRWFVTQQELEVCWQIVEEFERMRLKIPLKVHADGSEAEAIGV